VLLIFTFLVLERDRGSRVRFPAGAGNFSLHHRVHNGSGAHQPPIQWEPGALSLGYSGWGVKLTTHFHLVPRSRMRGAIPALPQYVFMVWCSVKAQGKLPFFTFYGMVKHSELNGVSHYNIVDFFVGLILICYCRSHLHLLVFVCFV
jgi:hypothetical protein